MRGGLLAPIRRHLEAGRGQTAVEFALVAPLIFLLLMGIVDFGRAMFYQNELTNAAREGTRIAVLASNPCNTVIANPGGNCGSSSGTGTTICQAIQNEMQLISQGNWQWPKSSGSPSTGNCASVATTCGTGSSPCDGTPDLPANTTCTTCQNEALVYVVQYSAQGAGAAPCSGTETSSTPRVNGNKPVQVTIIYYFTPVTPFLGQFFPSTFHLTGTSCGRAEW